MTFEKVGENIVHSLKFNSHKELVDIDFIFRQTNTNFSKLLIDMEIVPTFDFSVSNNKRLYTHEFLKTFMEYLKNRNSSDTLYLFSNSLTKDKFRNSLIKKIQKTFGFLVWEDVQDLESFSRKIEIRDCNTIFGLETLFLTERRLKNFKSIRRHLEASGLTFLNDVYFQELQNKLQLFR